MMSVVILLTQVLVVLIFCRIVVEFLPKWLLGGILLLLVLHFGILDPRVVRQMVGASSGLVGALIPLVFLLVAFRIVASGVFGGRKR